MKTLSPEAVAQYRRDGFYFPLRVLSPEEAAGYRARLEAVEGERGGPLGGELRHKGHLLFTWLDELIRHPRILDAVEDILGPNLLCWSSSFFIKEARDPAFVSWHQDSTQRAGRGDHVGGLLGELDHERRDAHDPGHAHRAGGAS
jgi:non-heme Fe2+,alpha-ketoglutarate-dependent halogenase